MIVSEEGLLFIERIKEQRIIEENEIYSPHQSDELLPKLEKLRNLDTADKLLELQEVLKVRDLSKLELEILGELGTNFNGQEERGMATYKRKRRKELLDL